MGFRPTLRRVLIGLYLALLAVSWVVRAIGDEPPAPAPGQSTVLLHEVDGTQRLERKIQMSFHEDVNDDARPTVILMHGSPGSSGEMVGMMPWLEEEFDLLAPDLPGFGTSETDIADYSFVAHARYMLEWMDLRGIDDAHLVGFSFGGGVALSMIDIAPERVRSLTLLSSITVQEMELLGDFHLNRAVHGMQLAGLWSLRELTPHFGAFDGAFLGVPYARNFYDSDQRPLRRILEQWNGPTLIVHGKSDFLVPPEAALEAERLVPHSELEMYDTGHFMVFQQPKLPAGRLLTFFRDVEAGRAPTRESATPERLAAAAEPFDPRTIPAPVGLSLLVVMALIALATFVSEDLTCIATGLMVASGRIDFVPGVLACVAGISIGDIGLFLAGRWLGARTLHRAPMKWFVKPERVHQAREWLERRGLIVILISRFIPGARLTTYFVSGLTGVRLITFAFFFLIAAFLWTPLIVGASYFAGEQIRANLEGFERLTLAGLFGLLVVAIVIWKLIVPLFSYRGRRSWASLYKRWTRWEFWPRWFFYPPLVLAVLARSFRFGGPTVCTAANPAIPGGGFVGESKYEILQGLGLNEAEVAGTALLGARESATARFAQLEGHMERLGLSYPVVLKPDVGERGADVAICQNADQAREYLETSDEITLVQEYVPGVEFGLFYVRLPEDERGSLFSITEKKMPCVIGDGQSSLERLILADPRAVAQAAAYTRTNALRLHNVPAEGESVQLVELGTHCRGAIFLDGARLKTAELERAVDRVSRRFEGFFFGRYDVRTPSAEHLQRGEFRVIELNGVTSEATHVYDPSFGPFAAYRTLFEQWQLAYRIGQQNVERGAKPASVTDLIRLARRWRTRGTPAVPTPRGDV